MEAPRVRRVLSRVAACACVLLLAGTAYAQPCADPDGDGDITESDGIITLQAAAGLDTDCSLTICDINIDGVIDDVDAVLVFRKAADLEVEENCLNTSSGSVDQRVVILLEHVLPFLQVPFQYVPQIGGRPTPGPDDETIINCDNFGDGDIEITADEFETVVIFTECRFGNTIFEGDLTDSDNQFFVSSLAVVDRFSEDDVTFDAEGLLVSDTGMALRISGLILATPFFSVPILEDADEFDLSLFAVEVTPTGEILAGRATLDLVEAGLPGLRRVVLEFDGTNIAVVTITDDAFADAIFLYDLAANRFL